MGSYNLNDFEAVFAISRRGSFRAAAPDPGMSTTALSNAIAKLESQLGVRLFNRTTRSVSLTDAGRKFVDQTTPALKDVHQVLDTVRAEQGMPAGTLRINALGIGFFMESDVLDDIRAGRVVRRLEDWTPRISPICLYYPSRRNPPAAFRVFVDLARELARSIKDR